MKKTLEFIGNILAHLLLLAVVWFYAIIFLAM
jgi:hypothetical protein